MVVFCVEVYIKFNFEGTFQNYLEVKFQSKMDRFFAECWTSEELGGSNPIWKCVHLVGLPTYYFLPPTTLQFSFFLEFMTAAVK